LVHLFAVGCKELASFEAYQASCLASSEEGTDPSSAFAVGSLVCCADRAGVIVAATDSIALLFRC